MASKYLQKYYVPLNFTEILSDLTREILRSQTDDIIQFCADYFEEKINNKDHQDKHNDNYNYDTNKKKIQTITEQAKNVVYVSNDKIIDQAAASSNKQIQADLPKKPPIQPNTIKEQAVQQKQQKQPEQKQDDNNVQDNKPHDTSAISHNSGQSHPDEKKVTKEFMGNLYDSALDKMLTEEDANQGQMPQIIEQVQQQPPEKKPTQTQEPVVLDGPIEEYEQAAKFMQAKFKTKQMRKNK